MTSLSLMSVAKTDSRRDVAACLSLAFLWRTRVRLYPEVGCHGISCPFFPVTEFRCGHCNHAVAAGQRKCPASSSSALRSRSALPSGARLFLLNACLTEAGGHAGVTRSLWGCTCVFPLHCGMALAGLTQR